MSALEEIQAAIDALSTMRAVSDSGAWAVGGRHPHCGIEGDAGFLAGDLYDYDADLIVTLHRTIDAQLAILQQASDGITAYPPFLPEDVPDIWHTDLALARAINGAV